MIPSRSLRAVLAASLLAVTPALAGCVADATPGDEQDLTSSAGLFQTFKGDDGQYYFHLVAGNYEKVLQSEGYTTLAAAKKGVESVKTNGVDSKRYKVLAAKNGEYYFNLVAANGEVIGTSETYSTKSNATAGVTTVKSLIVQNLRTEAATTGGAKFEVFTGADKQTYFHLKAGNGEIVLASEGYTDKAGAINGISSVRTNGAVAASYEIIDSTNGQAFFHLKATNGEIIGSSEIYVSHSNADHAVKTIAALLASEKVADPK